MIMSKRLKGLAISLSVSCAAVLSLPAQSDPVHKIPHQKTPAFRMQSPLSTSVLIARAVKAGLLKPSSISNGSPNSQVHLPSSVVPNVQASGGNGGSVANETPII